MFNAFASMVAPQFPSAALVPILICPLLVPEEFYKKAFIAESLDLLGLNYYVLEKNHIYKIKELLITSKTAETGNYNEKILKNLTNNLGLWLYQLIKIQV